MTEDDIRYILEYQNILRFDANRPTLNCDPEFLENLISESGYPGRTLIRDKIRWKPSN